MEELPDIDKIFLAVEAKKIIDFANANLDQLYGKCQEPDTTQDYFLGILRRQIIILYDLNELLKSSVHNNFTTLFVLCRCLTDDFLFMTYLKTHKEKEDESIIKITASAYSKSFKALEILAQSNHKHFNGEYPFYLNNEEFEKLKVIFQSKETNDKYFKDKETFTFKAFLQLTQLAEHITDFELSKTTLRAFYLWKEFSDFIHYSNITFELEMNEKHNQIYLRHIEETLTYCFNTVEMAFRYFADKHKLKTICNKELSERYFINVS